MPIKKNLFIIGWVCLALLPIHAILNWLFESTPLLIWKQLLFLVFNSLAFYYLFFIQKSTHLKSLSSKEWLSLQLLVLMMLSSILLMVFLAFVYNFTVYRIVYSAIAYIGFIGAISFVLLVVEKDRLFNLFLFVSLLSFFSCMGLVLDYFYDFLYFLPISHGLTMEMEMEMEGYLRRSSFLFGTSTVVLPFIGMGLVFVTILAIVYKAYRYDLFYFVYMMISLFGVFLTGSRTQFILYCFLLLISYIVFFTKRHLAGISSFFVMLILFIYVFDGMFSFFDAEQLKIIITRYINPLDATEAGNNTRFDSWLLGIKSITEMDFTQIFGVGLGSSFGMINDGRSSTGHFESSLLMVLHNTGLLGAIVYFSPLIFALYYLIIKRIKNSFLKILIFSWFLIYSISILVAPSIFNYHISLSFFIMVGLSLIIVDVDKMVYLTSRNHSRKNKKVSEYV